MLQSTHLHREFQIPIQFQHVSKRPSWRTRAGWVLGLAVAMLVFFYLQTAGAQPRAVDPSDVGPSASPFMNPQQIALTSRIRQDLMSDKTLSALSQNVIVISEDNRVVLKGAVSSEREKALVEAVARRAAGPNMPVVNETVVQ